jgi:hypothetical protein
LTSDSNPVCQVLNYWNVCQVVKLRGEFDRRGAISNFELFLKKLTDVGAIREYSFAKPENQKTQKFTRVLSQADQ